MASNLLVLLIHIVITWTFTEGKSKIKDLCQSNSYNIINKGQLVEEQRATCHTNMAIYRCTNNQSGFLTLVFEVASGQHEQFGFSNILTPEGTVTSVVVGSSPVILNVTSSMETFISVTFIILNPVSLIGTTIKCIANTIQLDIISRYRSK